LAVPKEIYAPQINSLHFRWKYYPFPPNKKVYIYIEKWIKNSPLLPLWIRLIRMPSAQ
jgi:hypothetical protein